MQVRRHNSMHYLVEEKHLRNFRQTFIIGLGASLTAAMTSANLIKSN